MNEAEFADTGHRLLNLLNTQGWPAMQSEMGLINEKLHAENQRLDFSGNPHLGTFLLYDSRTNTELCRCSLGSLKSWPGSPFARR